MRDVYEYRRVGQNPFFWIVTGLVMAMSVWGLMAQPVPLYWAVLAIFSVANLASLFAKTTHGLRIEDARLTVSPGRDADVISLNLIKSIRYVNEPDRHLVAVIRVDGRVKKYPPVHFPPVQQLRKALADTPIDVIA